MTYFHLLTPNRVQEAISLPNKVFQKKYSRPVACGFFGALDQEFGCPFLIPYTLKGADINERCKRCTCRKEGK